ncbi:ribbon-helix-helix protein, CopG family [Austwickia sp. TVS 96-490-7B]|uniref:type II toxin-antitoxin system RelB family antitoxin n=1 Tax=Austwickia sp. TVS 96-490-7B TaxID=2830843 RepID=UPI001C598643|nr:ribbon-helix-helix domain-containing protein [Austwickia sp. TVS 96-490-7B]
MTGEALGRPVSVRLPESLRVRVEALAAATRRSRGDVLREAMEREVDRLEWEQQLLARAVQVRTGQVRALSADEVDRMLGLDGVAVPADAVDDLS